MRDMIAELREILPPQERAELDKMLKEAAERSLRRYREMEAAVRALAVLHREGSERAGFCGECGNVVPCQTVRFIAGYL